MISNSNSQPRGSLRQRILATVGGLVLLSLFGSGISLYRITEVNRRLDAINRVSVPLGRLLVQLQADADLYQRELDRRLGQAHWSDSHWKARPIPKWIEDVIDSEAGRAQELIAKDLPWTLPEARETWGHWLEGVSGNFQSLREDSARLVSALEKGDLEQAGLIYPRWMSTYDTWMRSIEWGVGEHDRTLRQNFSAAENQVAQLRTGLEIILVVVVSLSLLLLWLGERALRPLTDLARLARDITMRGLRKEDKALLPEISLSRNDEVSQLAREFHRMATALLEREKTVEIQKSRLQDQNRQLRDIGELNKNILHSIESVLLVTDLHGKITQCNPVAARWLGLSPEALLGQDLLGFPQLQAFEDSAHWVSRLREAGETLRIEPVAVDGRVYGGQMMALKQEGHDAHGAILVLEDLTDELDLQSRLRYAEKLAAVGRMSAQVAHEVRNPLHSIGLEAELALEMASSLTESETRHPLRQSLGSILASVDRLEKITENYLKLSRLSSGEKRELDLGEVLESVLAQYSTAFESQGVRVDWSRRGNIPLRIIGDPDLLENAVGNLLRNSLQALQGTPHPEVRFELGQGESGRIWLRISDNGPGIAADALDKLFTPFFTTRAQGTGLGLSFVKKVVDDHGGSVQCIERGPGQAGGACFEIALPEIFPESPAEAAAEIGAEV